MTKTARILKQLTVVLLYIRLYKARFGLVTQPQPRGALMPNLLIIIRLIEIRAAIDFLNDGILNPNFIMYNFIF